MKVIPIPPLWGIRAGYYSQALTAACRAVPGMVWNAVEKAWVGAPDAIRLVLPRLRAAGVRCDSSEFIETPIADFLLPIASKGLRSYQVEGVRFLLAKKRCILGDAMGLGKSAQALTAARALSARTLIVCPSYVRGVWSAPGGELAKWWPHAATLEAETLYLPGGVKAQDIPAGTRVVVIHYDILHAWADALIEWGPRAVIIDEAHALMNWESRRTKAVNKVCNSGAEFVWALTGTLLTNRPRDLWAVVEVVSPGRFGGFFSYALRYCNAHKITVGAPA